MKRLFSKINVQTCVLIVFAIPTVMALGYLFIHYREGFFTLTSALIVASVGFGLNTFWNSREQAKGQEKKDIASTNNLGAMLDELHRTQCVFYDHYHPKRTDPDRAYTIAPLMIDDFDRRELISEDIKFLTRLDEPKIVKNIQIVVRHYNNLIKILIERKRYFNILQDRIRQKYKGGRVDLGFIDKRFDRDWLIVKELTDKMIKFCDQNILDIENVRAQLGEIMRQKFPKADIHYFRGVERNNNQPTNTSK